ncbi:putative transcriptional regulator [metagenome]|uniref:Putative transcriptional regulator n=1 Tax=metagenome TaxID=256318 RepID=A0A2P2C1G7_9ZZZZ
MIISNLTCLLINGAVVTRSAQRILDQARGYGLLTTDELVRRTGLTRSDVTSTVEALLATGVLRERADQRRGDGGTPLQIDPDRFATIGIHLGRRLTTVGIGDLAGRVVSTRSVSHHEGVERNLDRITPWAHRMLAELPGRVAVSAGVVAPWRDLGLDPDRTSATLASGLGLPVAAAHHLAALALTETRQHSSGRTLFVYGRDTVGFAVAEDRESSTTVTRVGRLTHVATGSATPCDCGRQGCLEVTVGDHAVALRAHRDGLITEDAIGELYTAAIAGNFRAHALLTQRAETLGAVAAQVQRTVRPDRVILAGQAFTSYRPALEVITRSYASTVTDPAPVTFSRLGGGMQSSSACTIALGPVYADPLAVVGDRVGQPVGGR